MNPVTNLQREVLRERIEELKEGLLQVNSQDELQVVKGMIHAHRETLEWMSQIVDKEQDELSRKDSSEQGNSQTEN